MLVVGCIHGNETGGIAVARALERLWTLILRLRPHVTIWFHQHLDLVWASGGNRRIEEAFARVSGLPYRSLPPLAGSAISWQNTALPSTTAFAAEFPAGQPGPAAFARYVRAVLAAARQS